MGAATDTNVVTDGVTSHMQINITTLVWKLSGQAKQWALYRVSSAVPEPFLFCDVAGCSDHCGADVIGLGPCCGRRGGCAPTTMKIWQMALWQAGSMLNVSLRMQYRCSAISNGTGYTPTVFSFIAEHQKKKPGGDPSTFISSLIRRLGTAELLCCGPFKDYAERERNGAVCEIQSNQRLFPEKGGSFVQWQQRETWRWVFWPIVCETLALFGRGHHYPEILILFLFLCQVCKQGMWLCLWNSGCKRLWVLLSDVLRHCALTELVL